MINIQLYLNDEEETYINSLNDMKSNPFSLGDVITLSPQELVPADIHAIRNTKVADNLERDSKVLYEKFRLRKVKLVREGKYMRFKSIGETYLTIEYHCEFVDD